jgi:putative sigma-54 modulation protein
MQFSVTFRHMEPTESLKSYARDRMERVKKYLPDPISCHVVLSTERHMHRVDVSFQLHDGESVAGHESSENMYSSIDLCIAKIERQVRNHKGRLEERRVRPHAVDTREASKKDFDASSRSAGPTQTSDPPTTDQSAPRRLGAQAWSDEAVVETTGAPADAA